MKNKVTVSVTTITEVEVSEFYIDAGVRYWEDASVNGQEDSEEEPKIFGANGDRWQVRVNLETGCINGWPEGMTADIHYKVCDDGTYMLYDAQGGLVAAIEDDYVPKMLAPLENGYGDYIIMEVDGQGKIKGWKPDWEDLMERVTTAAKN